MASSDDSIDSRRSSPFLRKPLDVVRQQSSMGMGVNNNNNDLHRHLSLADLIGIGVGGTVGSGIFVLTGQIAAQYAGAATWLSFLIAGVAATLSGCCYAELSSRIPADGSTYVYCYICLGEIWAVLAGACLTLEYGIAGAAVARTWGDKLLNMLGVSYNTINLPACGISAASTLLLYSGVQESKTVMNYITVIKMLIVAFMVAGGLFLYRTPKEFAPFGPSGIARGATTSFFGYLGYDEVCCVAGEAKNPKQDMPRAVLGTLVIVTLCYILAAISLTGMVDYAEISPTAGFPEAFHSRNWNVAGQITAIGEIMTLPVVVLISLMAQPRLTHSMAVDGLLPKLFRNVDASGNLKQGTLVSGVLMTILATAVPFTVLDDLISAGILVAFSMTNSCLVLLRCESPLIWDGLLEQLLILYNALCFISSMLWSHSLFPFHTLCAILSTLATIACFVYMAVSCPKTRRFGGCIFPQESHEHDDDDAGFFQTPAVPLLPCLGMAVNWYLVAQLDVKGLLFLFLYLGIVGLWYHFGCARNSNSHNWDSNVLGKYETVETVAPTPQFLGPDGDEVVVRAIARTNSI